MNAHDIGASGADTQGSADPRLNRLYDLLPVVHRMRDAELGGPLQALLKVIAAQVNVAETDIMQLYDNWFIETCEDWVVPYIADLIGYSMVHTAAAGGDVGTPEDRLRNAVLTPRREVANTLRYRRRKGTLALLEDLTRDVAGWPARAVEFYQLLGWTQSLNHMRLARGQTVDLRRGDALDRLGGPFDEIAHTVDIRRIGSQRTPGRYNIPSVGVFVWRLRSYPVTRAPAYCLEERGPYAYTFSILGNDSPLFNRPVAETDPDHIAEEINVPCPIRRRVFETRVEPRPILASRHIRGQVSARYYGIAADGAPRSVVIWAPDWPTRGANLDAPIPADNIIPVDLQDWKYIPPKAFIAVDPERGRIAFPPSQLPRSGVFVSYNYGFSADIGGGEYPRSISQSADATVYRIVRSTPRGASDPPPDPGDPPLVFERLATALEQVQRDAQTHHNDPAKIDTPFDAVIEIDDDEGIVLSEQMPRTAIQRGDSLQIRAASGRRPVIRLLDAYPELPDALTFSLAPASRLTLDGLLITGRAVHIEAADEPVSGATDSVRQAASAPPPSPLLPGWRPDPPAAVHIRHCTLVPGWALNNNCEPKRPAEPSLEVYNVSVQVTVEHSILGSIQAYEDQVRTDPIIIDLSDSILDATGSTCPGPECDALSAPGSGFAHVAASFRRCTVFGRVRIHAIDLAENSIFDGEVLVARRQRGCIRFCYVSPESRTPRRYHCQPDLTEQPIREALARQGERDHGHIMAALTPERLRVRPLFASKRYGTPEYGRLALACAREVSEGADDTSEMGVYHKLFKPQRTTNVRTRVDEFSPAGMDVGIIFAT